MNGKQRVKAELMIFALNHDYLCYGSSATKQKSGKYKVVVDDQVNYYTLKALAEEFDMLNYSLAHDILENYQEEELRENLLNTELKDDDTETGGLSHYGETLREFLDDTGISHYASLDRINEALKECGIQEIRI